MNNIILPVNDRLLLFGYGLFETILITSNGPQLLQSHWQRMREGATILELTLPDFSTWSEQIKTYLDTSLSNPPYALRITLSGGSPVNKQSSQLFFQNRSFPYTCLNYEKGIRLYLLPTPRNEYSPLNKIKSTNYLENFLAKEEALQNNAEEGLWLNTKNYIVEGTMSNIFFVSKQTLYTPSLDCGCLPGTRRSVILKLAAKLKISINEGSFSKDEVFSADEVFLTNALMGIMPVQSINEYTFNVNPPAFNDSITRLLERELMKELTKTY